MYRYTTPTLPIKLKSVDFSLVDKFRIALKEKDKEHLLFIVDADDEIVDAQNKTIFLELTQEETASLQVGDMHLQIRIIYRSGKVQATRKEKITVEDVYDKVIV